MVFVIVVDMMMIFILYISVLYVYSSFFIIV